MTFRKDKIKWRHDHLPEGFPTQCTRGELRSVIQHLYEEFSNKTKEGKVNKSWEVLINSTIDAARSELQHRITYLAFWTTIIGLAISLLAVGVSVWF